jgi:hypothetical protein
LVIELRNKLISTYAPLGKIEQVNEHATLIRDHLRRRGSPKAIADFDEKLKELLNGRASSPP